MKELGFILDKAARSSTGMPSVSADIFHFSKAVFHPTTALCTLGSEDAASSNQIFNETNSAFPTGLGNIRVARSQLSGGFPIKHQMRF
jgi:hypothetical protein